MKSKFLGIMLIVIFSLNLISCQIETAVAQNNGQQLSPISPSPTEENKFLQSKPVNDTNCYQSEQQALATTVRVQMEGWVEFDPDMGREPISNETISHGTVVAGRYLITHNHFGISPIYQGNGTSLHATLYDASGKMLIEATAFSVAFVDTETLVLEFTDKEGQGLFESLGISSAPFLTWDSAPLISGMEVAQVSWDGMTTNVDCVIIESIILNETTPRLELANDIQPGSSGGGIFWQGYHIANNWQRTGWRESGSTVIWQKSSSAALNPLLILTAEGMALPIISTLMP